MRQAGTIILLYAFMVSYFGVGSLRNVLSRAPIPDAAWLLALLFGMSWIAFFVGGILLLMRRAPGIAVGRAAAGTAAGVNIIGTFLFWSGGHGLTGLVFTLSRPLYDLFLLLTLPALAQELAPAPRRSSTNAITTLLGGAMIPWAAAFAVMAMHDGQLVVSRPVGLIGAIFLSLWCALPFVVLLRTSAAFPDERSLFIGGLVGTSAASFYAYGLIWEQQYNNFLLALLPPVVFAGQAIGLLAGRAFARRKVP